MTSSGLFALVGSNLARNRRGAVLSAVGVMVGVGCLTFFMALGQGITSWVRTRVFPADQATIEVVPPQVSLGSLFASVKLDRASVDRLRAFPGVADVLPKMAVRVPAASRYDGDFFGHAVHMGIDVMAVGVDPRLVAKDLPAPERFVDQPRGQPIPVVVSSRLLELYNKSFAAQRGLPQLSPSLLTGFKVPIEFGRSFVLQTDGRSEAAELEVAGFSEHALLGGVTVPLTTAERLNREYGQDSETFSSVVLRATGADALPAIATEVRRLGFEIDDSDQKQAERVGWGIAVVTGALAFLSALITALAAVNIAHAFYAAIRERRREIGILRSVGASQRDIMRILLTEASVVGLLGAAAGAVAGVGTAWACDLAARQWVPEFPFKPASFFLFTPGIIFGALAVGIAAALAGAFGPARSAARSDPAAALSE